MQRKCFKTLEEKLLFMAIGLLNYYQILHSETRINQKGATFCKKIHVIAVKTLGNDVLEGNAHPRR